MTVRCPKCNRDLPKGWSKDLGDGVFVHTCKAALRPTRSAGWQFWIGVLATFALIALLGWLSLDHEVAKWISVFASGVVAGAIAYFAQQPRIVERNSEDTPAQRRIA